MITEIVLFRLPDGMSRQDAIAKYRLSIPTWQANPDLIRKAFLSKTLGTRDATTGTLNTSFTEAVQRDTTSGTCSASGWGKL